MGFFLPFIFPAVIAHRGASHDAPENTLAAFTLSWQQGADGIEGDFRMSKDGKILCVHDDTTERISGVNVSVGGSSSDLLRTLDAGKWKDIKWAGERIPLIDEVFSIIPEGKKIFIEIKCGEEIVPALKISIERSKLKAEHIVIISFSKAVIAAAKEHIPHIKTLWLTDMKNARGTNSPEPSVEQILSVLRNTQADGVSIGAPVSMDETFAAALRKEKKEFHVWNVNDTKTAQQFLALGVDSMTTDRPGWLKDFLSRL